MLKIFHCIFFSYYYVIILWLCCNFYVVILVIICYAITFVICFSLKTLQTPSDFGLTNRLSYYVYALDNFLWKDILPLFLRLKGTVSRELRGVKVRSIGWVVFGFFFMSGGNFKSSWNISARYKGKKIGFFLKGTVSPV